MLIAIQFPIVDLRPFVADSGRLVRPGWPAPREDEFVRGFGAIRRRPSGGVNGWLGEATICDARTGIKFDGSLPRYVFLGPYAAKVRVAYRRLFADGLAVGKLELGFNVSLVGTTNPPANLPDLISGLMGFKIRVGTAKASPMSDLGSALSSRFQDLTTVHRRGDRLREPLVRPGRPSVIIDHTGRQLGSGRHNKKLNLGHLPMLDVSFWVEQLKSTKADCWIIEHYFKDEYWSKARLLRLHLSRLHAETEAISVVLDAMSSKEISPAPLSAESDNLQMFLAQALKRRARLNNKIDNIFEIDDAESALRIRDEFNPGKYDGLLSRIDVLNPRPAVKRALISYISEELGRDSDRSVIFTGEIDMSSTEIKVGTAGVVGRDVKIDSSTVTVSHTGNNGAETSALEALAATMKQKASNPDEASSAEAVTLAAEKLQKGDEAGAMAWLRKAGDFARVVAEGTGAKLAAELIVRSLI